MDVNRLKNFSHRADNCYHKHQCQMSVITHRLTLTQGLWHYYYVITTTQYIRCVCVEVYKSLHRHAQMSRHRNVNVERFELQCSDEGHTHINTLRNIQVEARGSLILLMLLSLITLSQITQAVSSGMCLCFTLCPHQPQNAINASAAQHATPTSDMLFQMYTHTHTAYKCENSPQPRKRAKHVITLLLE